MAVREIITIFLEISRLTNTNKRRDLGLKERVDPLTKYDRSEFHARFRLSKLTVNHLVSGVCQRVYLPCTAHELIAAIYKFVD